MKNIIKKSLFLAITLVLLFIIFYNNKSVEANEVILDPGYPTCYQQSDIRWRDHVNGNGTLWSSGCGILSTTNAINFLNGNFIDPVELADYAYDIEAYNTPSGGGTWRYLLYGNLDSFEQKYGFKITTASVEKGVGDSRMVEHLKNGGTVIGYVYGHFIAIVDYDEANDWYLVYDSAASVSKRFDYVYASWLTKEQLSTSDYMTVTWFCLAEKTFERQTQLDGFDNMSNGKAEAAIYTSKGSEYPTFSGYALDTRGINRYYYILDYDNDTEYDVSFAKRIVEYDKTVFTNVDVNKTGFNGYINTDNLKVGNHTINVFAETCDGGVLNIAEIELYISDVDVIDTTNKTLTLNLSTAMGEVDVYSSLSSYGCDDYCFLGEYGTCLKLGRLDFSLFKKAEIYYSTPANFDSDQDGVQSIIGLKRIKSSFGYHGEKLNTDYAIGYSNMEDGGTGFSDKKICTIDLKNINYYSSVYVNGYNQNSQYYVVDKVVFYYNDDVILSNNNSSVTVNEEYQKLNVTSKTYNDNNYNLYNLGRYENLTNNNYFVIKITEDESFKLNNCTLQLTTNSFSQLNQVEYNGNGNYIIPILNDYKGNVNLLLPKGLKIDNIYLTNNDYLPYHIFKDLNTHLVLNINNSNSDTFDYNYKEEKHFIIDDSYDPTCLENGLNHQYCYDCGSVILNEEIKALGHYSEDYYYNDESHYKICDRCGVTFEKEEHEFEVQKNIKFHFDVCKICSYKTNVTQHSYNEETHLCVCGEFDPKICQHAKTSVIPQVDSTCTTAGTTEQIICDKCKEVLSGGEEIPLKEHNYQNGVCTECGAIDPSYSVKKGCKKNIVSILSLISSLSIILYLRFNKRNY